MTGNYHIDLVWYDLFTNQLSSFDGVVIHHNCSSIEFQPRPVQILHKIVKIFNEKEGNDVKNIYGVVTTGSAWKFIKLTNNTALVDKKEYHIEYIEKIMGILTSMIKQVA